MYPPPPGMEKLRSQVNVTFWFWLMYPPPPRNKKVEIPGQCDILVLANVPPPPPPPRNEKVEISGQHDILVLIISRAGQWTRTPSTTPLQPKKWNAHFWIMFNFWWSCWSMDSNTICHPSPAKKSEMLIFGLRSTSDDRPGWSMDSNTICHPSPAKKSEMLIFSTAVRSRQRCLTNHYL